MPNDKEVKKLVAIFLIGLAGISVSYWLYLNSSYVNTFPRAPQASVGRIVPLNVHGTVVYLTEREDSRLTWLFVGSIVCAACGGALWKKAS